MRNKMIIAALMSWTFFMTALSAQAQDVITKKDGSDIQAKILEINENEVKYKKFDYLDGPTFTMLKSEILIVRYANGTNEVFNVKPVQPQGGEPMQVQNMTNRVKESQEENGRRRKSRSKKNEGNNSNQKSVYGITIVSGDASILQESANAYVIFDYSSATVEGQPLMEWLREQGPDWVDDWPGNQEYAGGYFTENFNRKSKGLKIKENPQNANYQMVIQIKDMYMGGVLRWGRNGGGAELSGEVHIVDVENGQIKLSLEFKKMIGQAHFSATIRLGMAFFSLARQMVKLTK